MVPQHRQTLDYNDGTKEAKQTLFFLNCQYERNVPLHKIQLQVHKINLNLFVKTKKNKSFSIILFVSSFTLMFIFVLFYSSKGLLIWRIYTPAETKVSMSQTACDSLQMTELHVTVINVSSQNTYPVQCSQAKHHKKTTPSCCQSFC